jgi:transcription elongation factor GreA
MVEKVPMTPGGFVKLQEELRWRQQEERPRIIEAIAEARAHGDLSENAEYHAAKEAQSHNEGRISELEDLTARAEVIDLTKMSGDKIKFGAKVKLIDEDTEEERPTRSSATRKPTSRPAASPSPRQSPVR